MRVISGMSIGLMVAACLATAAPAASAECPDVELVFARGTSEPAGIGRVGRAEDGEVREAAEDADVLAGVVRRAERRIRQAAARADDHHRHVVVADVDADLLDHAGRSERRDRVGEGTEAREGEARRHAGHVRLRHAAVVEAVGAAVAVLVEQAVADVARQEHDPLVGGGQVGDRGGEGVSHAGTSGRPSSTRAFRTSSAVGIR